MSVLRDCWLLWGKHGMGLYLVFISKLSSPWTVDEATMTAHSAKKMVNESIIVHQAEPWACTQRRSPFKAELLYHRLRRQHFPLRMTRSGEYSIDLMTLRTDESRSEGSTWNIAAWFDQAWRDDNSRERCLRYSLQEIDSYNDVPLRPHFIPWVEDAPYRVNGRDY